MSASRLLLVNGQIVNEGQIKTADVLIEGGRIVRIERNLSHVADADVMDCQGQFILPGMIDDQVHFREPGLTHKGCIKTESRAAVMGGITSYMEMPNCVPNTTDQTQIDAKRALAAAQSYANYAFYLGATNHNIEDIKSIDTSSICGVKVFMGASTGNLLVDDPAALEAIFQHAPVLIATHCEHSPTIQINEQHYKQQFGDQVPFRLHADIRSREACWLSSSMALDLAKRTDAQLHVLHLTTADEMVLFSAAPLHNKRITAEACVHHLWFAQEDYDRLGARIKCNPSIKMAADREALWQALHLDKIDVIATDHAPHTLQEKSQNFWQAPAGLPLVQEALLCLLEQVHLGQLTLPRLVEKTAHAVAQRFGVLERGFIREGYWADLVVVDTKKSIVSRDSDMAYRCAWTPFAGQTWHSSITATLVNGQCYYRQGQWQDQPPVAQALQFKPHRRG
jgi:dihydroorotase